MHIRTIAAAALLISAIVVTDVGSAVAAPVDGSATAGAEARRLSTTVAGNPDGVALPAEALPVDTSNPNQVIGDGTPASCTSRAVVDAVARGGIITFNCGPEPMIILMTDTAKVVNTSAVVVLDGGGKVTLSGGGQRRILYMNTCDQAQIWTTSHCQDQETPQLTIQNMNFIGGNSTGDFVEGGGGGAVFVRGGRVKVLHSIFTNNQCDPAGPDLGGAALRVLSQSHGLPVIVATSTFTGGNCSNGSALSSIGVSWQIYNSVFTGNNAIGSGANPIAAGRARWWERWRDLPRRQSVHARSGRQHRHRQHGERGRRCDLLRVERSHRRAADHELDSRTQSEPRLRDRRLPRHLLPRPRRSPSDQLDPPLGSAARFGR